LSGAPPAAFSSKDTESIALAKWSATCTYKSTGFDWDDGNGTFEPGSNTQMFNETRNGV